MRDLRIPAVRYIWMSTEKQEDSPARQWGEIERMAAKGGYLILCRYEDHGLTGTESLNRPEFQRRLKDAAAGKFRAVLMYEQSRFSREDA
ncbi:MAG TPA: recombinase family protein, partial [Planctomycetaceae bacterium]|nr:recombinase family protein [Planctomycetaceae bacterium]